MPKHAFCLASFTDAGTELSHPARSVIRDLADGQFLNWEHAGLIREATADEVAAAFPDPAPTSPAKPAGRRRRTRAAAVHQE